MEGERERIKYTPELRGIQAEHQLKDEGPSELKAEWHLLSANICLQDLFLEK
jgi:hypothetical protein